MIAEPQLAEPVYTLRPERITELINEAKEAYRILKAAREAHLKAANDVAIADEQWIVVTRQAAPDVVQRAAIALLRGAERQARITGMVLDAAEDKVDELRLIAGLLGRGPV